MAGFTWKGACRFMNIEDRSPPPVVRAMQCNELRCLVPGLPACCRHCHESGLVREVVIDGHLAVVCCNTMSIVLSWWGGSRAVLPESALGEA